MKSVVRADPRTGKLVRSVIVIAKPSGARTSAVRAGESRPAATPAADKPTAAPTAAPEGLNEAVERIAATHQLPPQLVHSVIKVESNYNAWAVSPKGAQGLMQLMPDTARRFGVTDAFNPVDNIEGGVKYLRYLIDLYGGDYRLALAAYNAGEKSVDKYGTVPPYTETQNYVQLVNRQLNRNFAATPSVPETKPADTAEAKPAGPARIQEIVAPDGSVRYVSR